MESISGLLVATTENVWTNVAASNLVSGHKDMYGYLRVPIMKGDDSEVNSKTLNPGTSFHTI